jgi:long-chain acyl-CoA synthetase
MILSQHFASVATKNLGKPAYRFLGKETSFSEFRTRVSRLSYLFLHEIGSGARVAFVTRNAPAVMSCFLALSNTRSLCIPIDPDRPPGEIIDWIKDSKATHIAVTNDTASSVKEMLLSAKISLPMIEIEKKQGGEYSASFTPPPDNPPVDADQVILLKTAGLSGDPKYVSMNHKQLLAAATGIKGIYHLGTTDRIYTRMNWAHPFAFIHGMLFPLLNGATCVIDHGLEGSELLNFLVESRVTRVVGIPSFFLKLLLICKDEKRTLPAAFKSVVVGIGRLSTEVEKAIRLMKIPIMHTYGQAEAGWTLAAVDPQEDPESAPRAFGGGLYVGRGVAGLKYKVVDSSGDEIPGREQREGLLCVTGPAVMSGYLDNEKETKTTLRGTWLYTGDFARLEGDADELKITYLGRRDDVMRIEDKLLLPDGIERALKGFVGVADSAGFLIKTSKGELRFGCAAVRSPGSTVTEKTILEKLSSSVPSDILPAIVVFTDVIPKDIGGNIIRRRLSMQFAGALG